MRRKAVIAEAQRLIEQFGPDAYENAYELARDAKRRRNPRLAAFHAAVARQIEKEVGSSDQSPNPRAGVHR